MILRHLPFCLQIFLTINLSLFLSTRIIFSRLQGEGSSYFNEKFERMRGQKGVKGFLWYRIPGCQVY